MLASGRYGAIYTGVTSDLIKRTWEHKEGFNKGFTNEYDIKYLVWYEAHEDIHSAITREKQIKKWNRAWKIRLIQAKNPLWRDLYVEVVG
jgi:putative endonuclease